MNGPAWRIERDGAIATLRLQRPEKHNLLKMAEVDGLIADLGRLDGDEGLRVVVLTGSGQRTFSAGVDLGDVLAHDWRDNPLARLADRIETLAPVTLCALNGSVYGGASDLALACDFRIGTQGMRLAMPPAKLGLVFHESGLRRYVERLGPQVARRLFLAAEEMDGAELLAVGFLDRLESRAGFEAAVAGFAGRLAALAPLSLRVAKKAIVDVARGRLDSDWLKRRTLDCFASEDAAEGLAAAREKRQPRFVGR